MRSIVELGERSYAFSSAPAPGTGCSRCCRSAPTGPRSSPRRTSPSTVDAGVEQRSFFLDRRRGGQDPRVGRGALPGFARWGLTRADVVVAVGGGVVTDVAGFAAAVYHRGVAVDPRADHPARPGRRRHRRQDRRQPARGQESGRCVLAAGRRPLRHRDPRHPARPVSTAAASARWPSTPSSASSGLRDLPLDDAVAACVALQGRGGRRRRARRAGRAAGPAQLRPHPGPRPGDRGPLRPAPRRGGRHRAGLRRPAGPAAWAASTPGRVAEHERLVAGYDLPARLPPGVDAEELVTVMARDKKASTTGSPSSSTAPPASRWWPACRRRPCRATLAEPRRPVTRRPSGAAAVGPQPQPARRARAGGLRHRHPRRPRRPPPSRRPPATACDSSTSSPTTRAIWSTPSTGPGAGPPPSSSTPAPSPTTPGPCTTPWPPSTDRSSSCTCPTPTGASPGGTPRSSARWPPGSSAASAGSDTAWPSTRWPACCAR